MLTSLVALLRRRGSLLVAAVLLIALVALPAVLGSDSYALVQLTPVLILASVAASANLAWGYTGIFTLGHAIFFGFGAYTVGLLSTKQHQTSLLLLLGAAAGVGLLLGAVLGVFLFSGSRVGSLYVGLVTLALAYVGERVANGWATLGAANGIPGVPLATIAGTDIQPGVDFYYVAVASLVVTMLIVVFIVNTQFGLVMQAVRDDEERAEFFGYRRNAVQVTVLAISSAIAAVAGGLYGLEEGFVSPTMLGVALSTQVLLWVVLGGRGTLIGPLVGVFLLQLGGQDLRNHYPKVWPILLGALLLATIVYLPNGLWGGFLRLRTWLSDRVGLSSTIRNSAHDVPAGRGE